MNHDANRLYRSWDLLTSRETVEAVVAKSTPDIYSVSTLSGPYTPEDSEDLNGKVLSFACDELKMVFEVVSKNALKFSENGGEAKDCFCNIKTLDHEIYMLNQLIPGYATSRQVTLIADMKTGCATVVDAKLGTEHSNIDVSREFYFGRLEGDFAGGELHHFTCDLVGKAIEWDYGNNVVHVKHMYTSNIFYTYTVPGSSGAWMASNPADYVKLRDNVYIFSFIEERQIGTQGLFVIDLEHLHDMGCFYGYGVNNITSACIGAIGKRTDELFTVFNK